MGPVFLLFAFWLLAVAITGVSAMLYLERRRHRDIVAHLALVTGQNIPLAAGVKLAADGERGRTRIALLRIAQGLEAGLPVGEAVRRGHPSCPGDVLSTIDVADAAGTLQSALRELQGRFRCIEQPHEHGVFFPVAYGLGVGLIVATVLSLSMRFAGPRLQAIFDDFEVSIPAITTDVLNAYPLSGIAPKTPAGWALRIAYMVLTWVAFIALLIFVASLRPRRADRVTVVTWLGDTIRWYAPGWRRAALAQSAAAALPAMDLALAAGWPLPDAVDHAADIDANFHWRNRLRDWSRRLRRGEDAAAAARESGMPELLVTAIHSGVREGDLRPGLRYCREYYQSLIRHWGLLLRSLLWPAVTLTLAFMVGTIVLGLFLPMSALVAGLCESIG